MCMRSIFLFRNIEIYKLEIVSLGDVVISGLLESYAKQIVLKNVFFLKEKEKPQLEFRRGSLVSGLRAIRILCETNC